MKRKKSNWLVNPKKVGNSFEQFIFLQNRDYLFRGIAELHKEEDSAHYTKKLTTDITGGTRVFDNEIFKYNGKPFMMHIGFELKTIATDNFPIKNLRANQLKALKRIALSGGIAFLLIEFRKENKVLRIDIKRDHIINEVENTFIHKLNQIQEYNSDIYRKGEKIAHIKYSEFIKMIDKSKCIFESNKLPLDFLGTGNLDFPDFTKFKLIQL